ncbi:crossover junction endodeoxyribonuclease RuvC [Bdellovibrio sp. BCCA]|uniref:crossover junction endodeoxyribonuclease RuvC n=1 Tax=Bdellovibrio sp. BCCA TaxID=3136281 RepID=UPI0030F1D993
MATLSYSAILTKPILTIIGLDVSLTGTGLSVFTHNRETGSIELKNLYLISTPPTKARHQRIGRFLRIVSAIESLLGKHSPDAIAIEGYALKSQGRAASDLPEIGGMIRLMIIKRCIPFIEIEPTSLKKHITGKGNVDKSIMIKVINELLNISVTDDNVSDASGLGLMLSHKLSSVGYDFAKLFDELMEKAEDKKEEKRLKDLRKKYGKIIPEDKLYPKNKNSNRKTKEVPEITVTELSF